MSTKRVSFAPPDQQKGLTKRRRVQEAAGSSSGRLGAGGGDEEEFPDEAQFDPLARQSKRKATIDIDSEEDEDIQDSEDEKEDVNDGSKARDPNARKKDLETHFAERLRQQGIEVDHDQGNQERKVREELQKAFASDKMGELEKFSMGGFWRKDGQFVDEDEEQGQQDAWFSSLSDTVKEKGASLKKKGKDAGKEESVLQNRDKRALLSICLRHTQPKENIMKALRRLGGKAEKPQKKMSFYQRKREAARKAKEAKEAKEAGGDKGGGGDKGPQQPSEALKHAFKELTEAADALLGAGMFGIYQATHEKILFDIKTHDHLEEQKRKRAEMAKEGMWEYKWSPDDPKVHGPFGKVQMEAWRDKGFFDNALLRKVGTSEWVKGSRNTVF